MGWSQACILERQHKAAPPWLGLFPLPGLGEVMGVIDALSGPYSEREPFSWVQTLTENADEY